MPLYNFSCPVCGREEERIVDYDTKIMPCEFCCGESYQQFSFGQRFEVREDAPWIKTVIEVVDKESADPVDRRFIAEPNRGNYHAWMRHHKLRPFENERDFGRKQDINIDSIAHDLVIAKKHRERIEI